MKSIFVDPDTLAQIAPDDEHAVYQMRQTWQTIIEEDPERLRTLYREILEAGERLLGTAPRSRSRLFGLFPAKETNTDLTDYVFLQVAASKDYIQRFDIKKATETCLGESNARLLSLIEHFAGLDDRQITDRPRKTETGGVGDCGKALIHLYFHHSLYGAEGEKLCADVAPLIPAMLRAFPEGLNNLELSLLKHHPDLVPVTGALIEDMVLDRGLMECGTVKTLALDLLSRYSRRDSPFHKKAGGILAPTLARLGATDDAFKAAFLHRFVFSPLDCDETDQLTEITQVQDSIARHEAALAASEPGPPLVISADLRREWIARDRKRLQTLETDFDGWRAARFAKAVQRVAVSANTRKVLVQIAKAIVPYRHPMLDQLLDEAETYRTRPRIYSMPKRSDNRFKDFGFKMLVIEELMYRQECLTPKFDIKAFADEYDKREISVEDDGYDIVPEVKTYFKYLPIPERLLALVENLHQSSGLDGGPKFMTHLYPFWDPGSGDEVIKVTAKAAEDLPLLPNLRRISGLENSRPNKALLMAIDARAINLIDEEEALKE